MFDDDCGWDIDAAVGAVAVASAVEVTVAVLVVVVAAAFRRRYKMKITRRKARRVTPATVPPAIVPVLFVVLAMLVFGAVVADDDDAVAEEVFPAVELFAVGDDDVEVEAVTTVPKKAAAILGFEDKNAAERLPLPIQPSRHAFALQQPKKGGFVPVQVYQSDPEEHSWSEKLPYASAKKEAGLRFPAAQPVESHGFVSVQQPTNLAPVVQAKKSPPLGQKG